MTTLQTTGVLGSPDSLELALLPADRGSAITFRARHKYDVYCPRAFGGCGDRLIVRAGEVRVSHLAHYGDRRCTWSAEPDRDTHLRIQLMLRDWAIGQGFEASIEYVLEHARTDLRISRGGSAHHVEVQLSPIPTEEMIQRTVRYAASGATVTWLCGNRVSPRRLGNGGRSLSIRLEDDGLQIRWAPLPGRGEYEPLSMWRLDHDEGLQHIEHQLRVAPIRRGLFRNLAIGLRELHKKRGAAAEQARRAANEHNRRVRRGRAAHERRLARDSADADAQVADDEARWQRYLRQRNPSQISDALLQVPTMLPLPTRVIMARSQSFERGRPILPDGRPACLMCARFVDLDWCVHPADPTCAMRWQKLAHRLGVDSGRRFSKHADLVRVWVRWTHEHKGEHPIELPRSGSTARDVAPDDPQGVLF